MNRRAHAPIVRIYLFLPPRKIVYETLPLHVASPQTPLERRGSVTKPEQCCAVTAGDGSSRVQVEGSSQKLVEASQGLSQNAESKPHRTMLLDGARGVWV